MDHGAAQHAAPRGATRGLGLPRAPAQGPGRGGNATGAPRVPAPTSPSSRPLYPPPLAPSLARLGPLPEATEFPSLTRRRHEWRTTPTRPDPYQPDKRVTGKKPVTAAGRTNNFAGAPGGPRSGETPPSTTGGRVPWHQRLRRRLRVRPSPPETPPAVLSHGWRELEDRLHPQRRFRDPTSRRSHPVCGHTEGVYARLNTYTLPRPNPWSQGLEDTGSLSTASGTVTPSTTSGLRPHGWASTSSGP